MYGLSHAMSALGGIMSLVMIMFRAALYPISQHMYYWNAIKRLFLARTSSQDLLLDKKKGTLKSHTECKITKYLDPESFGLENQLLC